MTELDNIFYVYLHRRNDAGEVFYVGKGKGRRAFVRSGRNSLWTRIADKHGFTVEIIARDLSEAQAFEAEIEAIKLHVGLCNFTLGGDGVSGYRHTEATRAVLSAAHSGRKQEQAIIEARAAKLRGKKRSQEFCDLMGRLHLGMIHSPETRQKMSAARTGLVRSADVVAKTAAWHKGKKRSDESRARMSDSQPKRSVICLCTGQVFSSIEGAADWLRQNGFLKATKTGVWFSASGRRERSYGYRWSYHEPSEPESSRVLRDEISA